MRCVWLLFAALLCLLFSHSLIRSAWDSEGGKGAEQGIRGNQAKGERRKEGAMVAASDCCPVPRCPPQSLVGNVTMIAHLWLGGASISLPGGGR